MTHEELVTKVWDELVQRGMDGEGRYKPVVEATIDLVVEACAEEAGAGTEPCGKRIAKRIRKLGGTP